MPITSDLFHLGNRVVELRQKIDKKYPLNLLGVRGELGEILYDLLELINDIRIASKKGVEEKKRYTISVECTEQQYLAIKEQLNDRELAWHSMTE